MTKDWTLDKESFACDGMAMKLRNLVANTLEM